MKWLPTFSRYLVAGGTNTVLGYLIYLALLQFIGYRAAYVIAFALGIAVSYLLLRFAVFRSRGRPYSAVFVVIGHLFQLCLGLVVVEVWVALIKGPEALAALVAVAVCTPLMFLIHKWIFSRRGVAKEPC